MENGDRLTGLLSFNEFIQIAEEEIRLNNRENGFFALVSTDFSKFKDINTVYTYSDGDKLIRELSDVFLAQDECVYACRPYSDHVVGLFFIENDSMEAAINRLVVIEEDFCKRNKKNFPKVSIHLNIGVYRIRDKGEEITSALDKANLARRSVKGNYSVPYALYTKKLQRMKEAESRLIPIFEKALEDKSILVYFQPKINVKEGRIQGAEALTRLLDEDGSVIPPDLFIPVLEESGKVLDLDWYVMRYVFSEIRKWLDEGKHVVPVSVNLSKIHFYHDKLVDNIVQEFESYGFSPDLVEFEVTESVFVEEADLIIKEISRLRSHGFKVSVDDFGSGYSSLNMIGTLPVDIIKLDKQFVKNCLGNQRGKSIIKGLIDILNQIDMEIVCEGIETKEEERTVYEFGCDSMQGFLYDKPIPVSEFVDKYII